MAALADLIGKRIAPVDLQRFCADAMVRCGLSPEDAAVSAEVLTTTDTCNAGRCNFRRLAKSPQEAVTLPGLRRTAMTSGTPTAAQCDKP